MGSNLMTSRITGQEKLRTALPLRNQRESINIEQRLQLQDQTIQLSLSQPLFYHLVKRIITQQSLFS